MKNNNFPPSLGIVEKNSIGYVQAAFRALEKGIVVVPLRSLEDKQRIDAAHISETISPNDESGWFEQKLHLLDSDDIAHISFTSGTEGQPKGVLISFSALNDVVNRVQSLLLMDDSVREYIGVPVYHSFGYARCRHVASVGGRFYIPSQGFDPRELSQMLLHNEVNALSLVPSLLRMLINTPDILGEERYQLRWLEIGSQAMSGDEKIAVKKLFPNANIVQHYGLTEASRTTLLQIDSENENVLGSVGQSYGDVQVAINNDGCICIKGSHLASKIIKDGKIISAVNDHGWLETTDLGRLDNGYLYFQGRADNVVNCGGQKLSTEKLELAIRQRLLSTESVACEVAASRMNHALYGEGFLVSYTSHEAIVNLKAIAFQCLAELGINAKSAISFNFVDVIPKTHTGKVQHKQLSANFEKTLKQNDSNISIEEKDVAVIFSNVLGISLSEMDVSHSIRDIGIDSLQSIQISIQLEATFGYLPANWRQLSVESLSQLPRKDVQYDSVVANDVSSESYQKTEPLWDGSSNMNPKNISFLALLKEDFITHDRDLFSQGLFALFVNRFGNWRMGIASKWLRFPMTLLYRIFRRVAQVFCGIKLDYTVHVGRRVKLEHFGGMILGARQIGDDTIIRQNTTFGIRDMSDLSAKPTIENGVNIGAGAVIVGDITIGRHSVIGPNSVVTEDLPPFSIVSVGAPIITVPKS